MRIRIDAVQQSRTVRQTNTEKLVVVEEHEAGTFVTS